MTAAEPASVLVTRMASPRAQQLWRAYSRGYDLAGRWDLVRVVGTVGLATLTPLVTFTWPGSTNGMAVVAALWLLLARTVFAYFEDRERHRAVRVHEAYDGLIFSLPWNHSLVGRPPAEEDIARAAAKKTDTAPTDWYADTRELPEPLAIVLSQRSSAAWGRTTHYTYALVLAGLSVVIVLLGITVGILAHAGLGEYLLRLTLPSIPVVLNTIDLSRKHWETSKQKESIEEAADGLWTAAVDEGQEATEADCRGLQDATYRLRLDSPRVAQWLYAARREQDEAAMRTAVETKLADYRAKRGADR